MIAGLDPNPLVESAKKLKAAGCKVSIGVLELEAKALNKRFYTFFEKKRPYIILKWAQTADGFIAKTDAKKDKQPIQISNEEAHKIVHRWRSEEMAIIVGTNTARYDNPQLNVRHSKFKVQSLKWTEKNPIRVVIDKELSLPKNLHLFDQSIPTIVFNSQKESCEI